MVAPLAAVKVFRPGDGIEFCPVSSPGVVSELTVNMPKKKKGHVIYMGGSWIKCLVTATSSPCIVNLCDKHLLPASKQPCEPSPVSSVCSLWVASANHRLRMNATVLLHKLLTLLVKMLFLFICVKWNSGKGAAQNGV